MPQLLYILGSTRSGTSALRNAICRTRFKGFGEGHISALLNDCIAVVTKHKASETAQNNPGTSISDISKEDLIKGIFRGYENVLSEKLGSNYLVDKTPNITPIQSAVEFHRYHSDARFIFCSRRHIDNIASKMKKFPDVSVEVHAREWAACHLSWLKTREQFREHGIDYVEIDHHELVHAPLDVATKIGRYLDLSDVAVSDMAAYFSSERPEGGPERDLSDFIKFSSLELPNESKEILMDVVGEMGSAFGYSFEDYHG